MALQVVIEHGLQMPAGTFMPSLCLDLVHASQMQQLSSGCVCRSPIGRFRTILVLVDPRSIMTTARESQSAPEGAGAGWSGGLP